MMLDEILPHKDGYSHEIACWDGHPHPRLPRPQNGDRRRHGDRKTLAAVMFVTTCIRAWQQLPTAVFGPPWVTAPCRFIECPKALVRAELHRVLFDELCARGELDWSRCAVDLADMWAAARRADRCRRGGAGSSHAACPHTPAWAQTRNRRRAVVPRTPKHGGRTCKAHPLTWTG
ncbi:hypothetical protein C5L38_34975 (plasmid) [Streptomyces sp. WAC00288]|nr:hypothetical protein C5L38_00330 [Streptomyces sp. WAC00288]AVI00251.1 hypothetical protein C5L38_34975 [Streptomyces sp. WAC00288]